jgi:DNA-binding beta-propeller fold protein YncE
MAQTLHSCDAQANVDVISTATRTVTATITLNLTADFTLPPSLTLTPDGEHLWISTNLEIYIVDTATYQIGSNPISLSFTTVAFTPDETEAYVSYFEGSPHAEGLALVDMAYDVRLRD